jgi:hypothetical protein
VLGHDYNPITKEVEGEDCKVQGQPGLNSKTVSNKTKIKKENVAPKISS